MLLQQRISEVEFYGYLVNKFRKIAGKSNPLDKFKNNITRYKEGAIT